MSVSSIAVSEKAVPLREIKLKTWKNAKWFAGSWWLQFFALFFICCFKQTLTFFGDGHVHKRHRSIFNHAQNPTNWMEEFDTVTFSSANFCKAVTWWVFGISGWFWYQIADKKSSFPAMLRLLTCFINWGSNIPSKILSKILWNTLYLLKNWKELKD